MNWQSWWEPVQQQRNRALLMEGMRRLQAAQNAPYGSLAQQWDPSNYGSLFRQWMPQVFDPDDADMALGGMQRRQKAPLYT